MLCSLLNLPLLQQADTLRTVNWAWKELQDSYLIKKAFLEKSRQQGKRKRQFEKTEASAPTCTENIKHSPILSRLNTILLHERPLYLRSYYPMYHIKLSTKFSGTIKRIKNSLKIYSKNWNQTQI